MKQLKKIVKKYFKSLSFFYRYLRHRIFYAFLLSIAVSFMDGLGLSMFLPLLKLAGDNGGNLQNTGKDMGKLRFIVEGIQGMGIKLTIVSILSVMLIFFILKGVAKYGNSIYKVILKQTFIRKIRLDLLNKLNQMSFKRFIVADAGRIQNTMSGEVGRVNRAFTSYFNSFQKGIMVAVYMGFAFAINTKFAVLVTVGGILTNFLYKVLYKHTKEASRKLTRYGNIFQGQIIQHVGHFKYLRATGMTEKYAKRLRKTIFKIEDSRRRIGMLTSIMSAAREPLLIFVVAAVIITQIKFLGGSMASIALGLLFFYRALTSLLAVQTAWNNFMKVSGSMENMQDFQKFLRAHVEKDGKQKLEKFERGITLKNVNFSYGQKPILCNINLQIRKNESIGFAGESGSGKTTLVNMVSGLLQEDEGILTIDDIPLKEIKKETYQEHIGYVSQDPVVFSDTIFNNITFWAPETPENIAHFERCIQKSSLQKFMNELPKGRHTKLGNNGINLSGGQKQRISIARELFKNIDILILDEATSALDSETEKEIQDSIDALKGEYTILVVAHRLSTIRKMDRVVLMNKGEIVDVDNFDRLAQKQGRFKRMVELQEL